MRTLMFILALTLVSCATAPSVREPADAGATPQERLARCLTRKGVKLYSAPTWCKPCQRQEAMFGDARSLLPIVSCEKPGDMYEASDACKEAGVSAYPTWEFPGGKRVKGVFKRLAFLAEAAGCPWNP